LCGLPIETTPPFLFPVFLGVPGFPGRLCRLEIPRGFFSCLPPSFDTPRSLWNACSPPLTPIVFGLLDRTLYFLPRGPSLPPALLPSPLASLALSCPNPFRPCPFDLVPESGQPQVSPFFIHLGPPTNPVCRFLTHSGPPSPTLWSHHVFFQLSGSLFPPFHLFLGVRFSFTSRASPSPG